MSKITHFEWLNSQDRRDTYRIHIRTALESDDLRALIEQALDPEPVTLEQIGAAAAAWLADPVPMFDTEAGTVLLDLAHRYRRQIEG